MEVISTEEQFLQAVADLCNKHRFALIAGYDGEIFARHFRDGLFGEKIHVVGSCLDHEWGSKPSQWKVHHWKRPIPRDGWPLADLRMGVKPIELSPEVRLQRRGMVQLMSMHRKPRRPGARPAAEPADVEAHDPTG